MTSKNGLGVFNSGYRYKNEAAWADEFGGEKAQYWMQLMLETQSPEG
jgi:hypothetical protein